MSTPDWEERIREYKHDCSTLCGALAIIYQGRVESPLPDRSKNEHILGVLEEVIDNFAPTYWLCETWGGDWGRLEEYENLANRLIGVIKQRIKEAEIDEYVDSH